MALEHAILVSLAERAASGYDLARRFDKSIGHFWQASHQQIYKVVARMQTSGLVSSIAVAQEGRPDKRVYQITRGGRSLLYEWSRTSTPTERLRSEFAVKVRGMQFGDPEAIAADIHTHRDAHQQQLDLYRADEIKNFPHPDTIDPKALGAYLVLRGGIRYEQGQIDWADEMLELLSVNAVPTPRSPTHRDRTGQLL